MRTGPETILEFEQSFQAFIRQELSEHTALNQAMRYALLGGGKRIRPLLVLETANLANLPPSIALRCAFALEIAHGFSLVHDDLPCMDNDDFRRGLPTVHKKFGEAQALLAGDALLNFAHQTFLSIGKMTTPEFFVNALHCFGDAISGMIRGQSEELHLDSGNLNELLHIQSLKTGKLFQASLLCPILLAGKTIGDSLYQDAENYADAFGFAFQIADDLEDLDQDRIQGSKNILSHLGQQTAVETAVKKLKSSSISDRFSATELLLKKLP